MYALVYLVYTFSLPSVYPCIPWFTYVMYTQMYTLVYLVYTYVYLSVPMYTHVYIPMYT